MFASKYMIFGHDIQMIQFVLNPADKISTLSSSKLLFCSQHVVMNKRPREQNDLMIGFLRSLTSDNAQDFFHDYINQSVNEIAYIAFGSRGKIFPVDLRQTGGVMVRQGSFLSSQGGDTYIGPQDVKQIGGVEVGARFHRISGLGKLFLHAPGVVVEKTLTPQESLQVEPASLVAFSAHMSASRKHMGVSTANGYGPLASDIMIVLKGPGTIYLSSSSLATPASYLEAGPAAGDIRRLASVFRFMTLIFIFFLSIALLHALNILVIEEIPDL